MPTESQAPRRAVVYCIVPEDLADKLHEPLRRHFAGEADVEVVVEQRWRDRRRIGERRQAAETPSEDRRRIRASEGRRVADRRFSAVPVETPVELPRKARPHAERIAFVERVEPSTEQLEDRDTARLVTRIQAGDGDGFAELYMRYFDRVYGYLRVALADSHEAEDTAQDVFASVLIALPRYERRKQPFRAWLFVIVRNHAVSRLRSLNRSEALEPDELDRRREEVSAGEEDAPAMLDWITDRELLMFIERLPAAQKQVLVLRYMLGLTTPEIAQVLGRTEDTVRRQQSRALEFLRERLNAVGREPVRSNRVRSRVLRSRGNVLRARRFALIAPGPSR